MNHEGFTGVFKRKDKGIEVTWWGRRKDKKKKESLWTDAVILLYVKPSLGRRDTKLCWGGWDWNYAFNTGPNRSDRPKGKLPRSHSKSAVHTSTGIQQY